MKSIDIKTIRRFAVPMLAGLILAGCVTSSPGDKKSSKLPTPNPHAKIGNPYKVGGRTYVPRIDADYDQIGIASWYGPNFHGKLTANGELFDQDRLTAAHKTLPLPSLVRVTNMENGRSAVLRLNDRGPFSGDRILDLSKAAAERLGTKEQGLGQVRVEYLGSARLSDAITTIGAPEDYAALHVPMEDNLGPVPPIHGPSQAPVLVARATPAPSVPAIPPMQATPFSLPEASPASIGHGADGYYVRIGSFYDATNVRTFRDRMPPEIPVHVTTEGAPGSELHHVKLGPYTHEFAAIEAQRYARAEGFANAHIVHEARAQ